MNILTVVGARPQFIKASAMSRELRKHHKEVLLHTGQHYDYAMSGVFFDGLELPAPDINLNVGSGSHSAQTGAMMKGIEEVMLAGRPEWLLVYGDTNSTLAGALAASKLEIPVAHIEAGLRSFNRSMPEEINRVVADHLSNLLLCPSVTAVKNLAAEGITKGVHVVGDVMFDVLTWAKDRADYARPKLLQRFGLEEGRFALATVHRSENTDNPDRLLNILSALNSLEEPVAFPIHPRARKAIAGLRIEMSPLVRLLDPLGYIEMVALTSSARCVLTDSGGLQKEAYWLGVPCLTLRDETEWVETVEAGWNVLVGSETRRIVNAAKSLLPPKTRLPLFGSGNAATECVALLERQSIEKGQTSFPANISAGGPAMLRV